MAERERRQLDAIGRIQRLFLGGRTRAFSGRRIVAAAVRLAGARSEAFLLDEGAQATRRKRSASASGGGGARVCDPAPSGHAPGPGPGGRSGSKASGRRPPSFAATSHLSRQRGASARGWQNLREQAALTQNLHDSEELHRIVTETGYEYSYIATIQEDGRVHLYTPRPDVAAAFAGVTPGMDPPDWHDFADPRDHPAVQRSHQELEEHGSAAPPSGSRGAGVTVAFAGSRRSSDWCADRARRFASSARSRDITREREAAEQLRERGGRSGDPRVRGEW